VPITLEWLMEGWVLFARGFDETTVEDVQNVHRAGIEMSLQVPAGRLVHLIVDTREVSKTVSLIDLAKLGIRPAPNAGWSIFISSRNKFVNFLTSSVSMIMGLRFRQVNSWPEALRLLNQIDDSLPDLSQLPEPLANQEVS